MDNPLTTDEILPAFERIRPEHIEPGVSALLSEARARIDDIAAIDPPTFDTVVEPLEALQHTVARHWATVTHLNAVLNSEPLRNAYNTCLPLLSAYETDLEQNESLYRAYRAIADREDGSLDPVRRRVIEKALRDFELAGVALSGEDRGRFKSLMLDIAQLRAKFDDNLLDATNAWSHLVTDPAQLHGLNEVLIDQARRRAFERRSEGWILILDEPTYAAVVANAESVELRRLFYGAWNTRASDQGPHAGRWDNARVIEQILRKRHQAARILGFGNFAEYVLQRRMARSCEEVMGFLQELGRAAHPAAAEEFEELRAFAGHEVSAWDVVFYTERLKRQRYDISQETLRPYFPLPRVLAGLFEVAERLFCVHIRERSDAPLWHPDVRFFEIESPGGGLLGRFYLDPYARAHKRGGAWMNPCVSRKHLAARATLPMAFLVLNVLPPGEDRPALLTHRDVLALFHEFGHALHQLLTRVDYPSLASVNGVPQDAVELPSQFMENYAWHPQVLERISGHIHTGAPLPDSLQRRLRATRSFHGGLQVVRQLELALFDFRLHAEYDSARGGRILEVMREVRRQVAVTPTPEWNRFPMSFRHIISSSYAAGYYSYQWAEVLAADAFSAFEENGLFDRATAKRFLDAILSRGASRDMRDAFVDFRGRPARPEALLAQYGILEVSPEAGADDTMHKGRIGGQDA